MKKIVQNKFLIILIISLLLVISIFSQSFASYNFISNDKSYSLPDLPDASDHNAPQNYENYNYLIIGNLSDRVYLVRYFNIEVEWIYVKTDGIRDNRTKYDICLHDFKSSSYMQYYQLSEDGSSWLFGSNLDKDWMGNAFLSFYFLETPGIYNSTGFDLKDVDGNLVFRRPPLGITETLVEETTKVEVTEQLKIMIIGFLKYLMVFLVSVIAFWKCWKFLSRQFKTA